MEIKKLSLKSRNRKSKSSFCIHVKDIKTVVYVIWVLLYHLILQRSNDVLSIVILGRLVAGISTSLFSLLMGWVLLDNALDNTKKTQYTLLELIKFCTLVIFVQIALNSLKWLGIVGEIALTLLFIYAVYISIRMYIQQNKSLCNWQYSFLGRVFARTIELSYYFILILAIIGTPAYLDRLLDNKHTPYHISNLQLEINELIGANEDTFRLLSDANFVSLPAEQKIQALTPIVEMEMCLLGIDNIRLISTNLSEEVQGQYNFISRTVELNNSLLEQDVSQIIHVILHECYHAYQYDCTCVIERYDISNQDLLMFRTLDYWYDELHFRQDFSIFDTDDYERYYYSSTELTARMYSDWRLNYYIDIIASMRPAV